MNVVKHKRQCARCMSVQKARRTKFLKQYPNYCRKCEATGTRWYHDHEGILQDAPCHNCLEKDLCPRCMTATMVEKRDPFYTTFECLYQTCVTCGWRGDDDYGDCYRLPDEPLCICDVI